MKNVIFLAILVINMLDNAYSKGLTQIDKGVHWSNKDAQIFLYEGKDDTYNVTIISDKELSVVYITSVNSGASEFKKLKPIGLNQNIRTYSFRHAFSKTTIWMSLKFSIDGLEIEELCRAFYNSIFDTVDSPGKSESSEQFIKYVSVLLYKKELDSINFQGDL